MNKLSSIVKKIILSYKNESKWIGNVPLASQCRHGSLLPRLFHLKGLLVHLVIWNSCILPLVPPWLNILFMIYACVMFLLICVYICVCVNIRQNSCYSMLDKIYSSDVFVLLQLLVLVQHFSCSNSWLGLMLLCIIQPLSSAVPGLPLMLLQVLLLGQQMSLVSTCCLS